MFDSIRSKYRQWRIKRRHRKKIRTIFDDKQIERNMRINGIKPQGKDFDNKKRDK